MNQIFKKTKQKRVTHRRTIHIFSFIALFYAISLQCLTCTQCELSDDEQGAHSQSQTCG